jgi:protocatechuate 3,4-dioxygenase beta subunit
MPTNVLLKFNRGGIRQPFGNSAHHALPRRKNMMKFAGLPAWRSCGPNPIGFNSFSITGAIQSVVGKSISHPGGADTFVLYAGAVDGGVWRADNFTPAMLQPAAQPPAILWNPLSDNAPSLSISCLALDPRDPGANGLWAGIGQFSSFGGFGGPPVGLIQTTNARDPLPTWMVRGNQVTRPGDVSLVGMSIVSVVPTTLMDSVTGQQIILVADFNGQGILRSKDGGSSFQRVNGPAGALTGFATDLMADPNDPQTFYAALRATYNSQFQLVTPGGIFRSKDSGLNWTEIDNGIPQATLANSYKLALFNNTGGGAPAPESTVLYVVQADTSGKTNDLQGIFRCGNPKSAQPQWTTLFSDPTHTLDPNQLPWPAAAAVPWMGTAVDPANWNNLYMGGQSWLYRVQVIVRPDTTISTQWAIWDAGGGWDHRSLSFLTDAILLGTGDPGVYGLTNPASSQQWVSVNNALAVTEFYSIAYDPTTGFIFGGAQDVGTPVRGDGAWSQLPQGGGDGGLALAGSDGVYYYSVVQGNSNVLLRNRNGNAVTPATVQAINPPRGVAVNPNIPNQLLVASGNRLLESPDQGDTVADITPAGMTGNISVVAYGTNNPNAAYVGTSSGQLFLRTAGNGAPQLVGNYPGAGVQVSAIAVDRNDFRKVVIISADGRLLFNANTTAGTAWTNLRGNVAASLAFMRTIELVSVGADTVILVAGDPTTGGSGIVRAVNPDTSTANPNVIWSPFTNGLPQVSVFDLHYYPSKALRNGAPGGDLLLAGTFGRGAWMIPGATAVIEAGQSILTGQVTDTAGTPIVDASIVVTPLAGGAMLQLATDANGVYSTPPLQPGDYDVSVIQSGFVPAEATVNIHKGVSTTTHDFVLQRTLRLTVTGQVTDTANRPISGATVTLEENSPIPGILKTMTGANGFYDISMDPGPYNGSYTVTAQAPGFVTGSVTIPSISNGATVRQDFALLKRGTLTGEVTDTLGTPIAGATVSAGSLTARTDSTGKYNLTLDPGNYTVTAKATGFGTRSVPITITDGGVATWNFVLVNLVYGVITGNVSDVDVASGIRGATVTAGSASTKTDGSGDYTLRNVPPGVTQVSVSAVHYFSDKQSVNVISGSSVTVDFTLTRRGGPPI